MFISTEGPWLTKWLWLWWQFQPLPALLHSFHIMITVSVSNQQLVNFSCDCYKHVFCTYSGSLSLQAVLFLWKWSLQVTLVICYLPCHKFATQITVYRLIGIHRLTRVIPIWSWTMFEMAKEVHNQRSKSQCADRQVFQWLQWCFSSKWSVTSRW